VNVSFDRSTLIWCLQLAPPAPNVAGVDDNVNMLAILRRRSALMPTRFWAVGSGWRTAQFKLTGRVLDTDAIVSALMM